MLVQHGAPARESKPTARGARQREAKATVPRGAFAPPSRTIKRRVQLAGRSYTVEKELGKGSFGSVWYVVDEQSRHFALKEIACKSEQQARGAMNEFVLMQMVSQGGGYVNCPQCYAYDCVRTNPHTWTVLCVMECVRGAPLDIAAVPLRNRIPQEGACALAGACFEQLAPTFCRVARTAVHRDVNAHNVLLDIKGDDISTAQFTLIDFGLAVDIREWQRSKWRELGVSGDARYWPASAWLMLYNELMQPGREAAVANYVHMSDIFAYALTVVQLLVEVMDRRCNLAKIFGPAWQAYWTSATKHWERVHATFTIEDPRASRMAWIKLKEDYSRAKVHNQTQATVRELQRALHLAAYEEPVYTNLFMTLARMLDASPISWDEVIAIYSGDDHTPVPVAALYSGEALGTPVPVFENAEKKSHTRSATCSTAPTDTPRSLTPQFQRQFMAPGISARPPPVAASAARTPRAPDRTPPRAHSLERRVEAPAQRPPVIPVYGRDGRAVNLSALHLSSYTRVH
jgi:serine/threonine protein kinase